MQNVVKGLAPLSSSVGARWDSMHETSTENPFGVIRGDMLHSKNRKWIGRFRHRWGLRLGKIPARDFMSTDDIHAKASSMEVFFRHSIAKQRFFQRSSNNVFICGAQGGARFFLTATSEVSERSVFSRRGGYLVE